MTNAGLCRRTATERLHALQERSPLRRVDPRVKVALGLALSLAIMLPLAKLPVALAFYGALLAWGRLLPLAGRLLWRLKWVLAILFVADWLLVSLELAVLVSLRIVLLSGSFALLFATTTPEEFRLALQWARMPHRYAFSLAVTVQSLALIEGEWRAAGARRLDAAHRLAASGADSARPGRPGCACRSDDRAPGVEHH